MAGAEDSRGTGYGGVDCEGATRRDADRFVTEVSDVALVVAITRRNRDALAEMYERHGAQVYGLARRLCGDGRAGEVVQQVFQEMWKEPHRYNPDRASLRAFLLTQVHRRSVDHLRGEGPRRLGETAGLPVRATAVVAVDAGVPAPSPGDNDRGLLGALPDGQRNAIVLAYFKGFSYRDVADLLGESEGTVKGWMRAGLAGLRRALSDEGRHSTGSPV